MLRYILPLTVLFIVLIVSPFDIQAASKSYYFPQLHIDVQIQPDARFRVTERRTFDFTGSFSRVY